MQKNTRIILWVVGIIIALALLALGFLIYTLYTEGQLIQKTTPEQSNSDANHNSDHVSQGTIATPNGDMKWPRIKNASDTAISNINKTLDFKAVTGYDLTEDMSGLTGVDYQINYDKDNILSITFFVDYMGAYPSETQKNYVLNFTTGKLLSPADIFNTGSTDELISLLNAKLQNNIEQAENDADVENPDGKNSGECSSAVIEGAVKDVHDYNAEYDHNTAFFSQGNFMNMKVTDNGIVFRYDFDFPHAIQACEPEENITLSFNDLKKYINPNGLLGMEIK